MKIDDVKISVVLRRELDIPSQLVESCIDRHQAQQWFKYIFRERANRWDVWKPCFWVAQHFSIRSSILSVGCGAGFNLLWYAKNGFVELQGFDIDNKAIMAARDISEQLGIRVEYWQDDATCPAFLPDRQFDIIEILNCMPYMLNFNFCEFIKKYTLLLRAGGTILVDVIDSTYDMIDGNQYLTSDMNKPIPERGPSEYKNRISKHEVTSTIAEVGTRLLGIIEEKQRVPRIIYIIGKD